MPAAERALQDSGLLALAGELVAPLTIGLSLDHIQVATSISGWDHEPGGGHIDGYGIPGQTEPATFTLLLGVYLGDESESGRGNLWSGLVRISDTSSCSASEVPTSCWGPSHRADTHACWTSLPNSAPADQCWRDAAM